MIGPFFCCFCVFVGLAHCLPTPSQLTNVDGDAKGGLYVPMTFYVRREAGVNVNTSAAWYTNLKEDLKAWIGGYLAAGVESGSGTPHRPSRLSHQGAMSHCGDTQRLPKKPHDIRKLLRSDSHTRHIWTRWRYNKEGQAPTSKTNAAASNETLDMFCPSWPKKDDARLSCVVAHRLTRSPGFCLRNVSCDTNHAVLCVPVARA